MASYSHDVNSSLFLAFSTGAGSTLRLLQYTPFLWKNNMDTRIVVSGMTVFSLSLFSSWAVLAERRRSGELTMLFSSHLVSAISRWTQFGSKGRQSSPKLPCI
jgi:hypothetical protein